MMYAHQMIDIKDLTSLDLLKTKCIYCDEFIDLPKEKQKEIFDYCITHATHEMCRKNLSQIRYAVTYKYFGYRS